MTFMAPWWFAAAAALGAALVVLHLLARRRPRPFYFPTARFIPDRPTTAASLAARPTDLPVLLWRLLLIVVLGAAFARPITSPPDRTAHLVLLDQSRLAPSLDSAGLALIRSADVVIVFDSSTRRLARNEAVIPRQPGSARGSISAALVAALRVAPELAATADSIALTIVSPFVMEEFDQATIEIREQWRGRIALVPVSARRVDPVEERFTPLPDDPLAATVALLGQNGLLSSRLIRGRALARDTAWARTGNALVIWPRRPEEAGWTRRPVDTVGGVAVEDQAVVAAFPREFDPPAGTLAAVWADGAAAATASPLGQGCIRNVAIPVTEAGDLAIRPSFLRLGRLLLAPCSGWNSTVQAPAAWLDSLRGPTGLLSSTTVVGNLERKTPAHRWLLFTAAFIFALEPLVRRRKVAG